MARTPGATPTTRAIALTVHCLRRSRLARSLPSASDWLAHGAGAEAELLRRAHAPERRLLPLLRFPPMRGLLRGLLEWRVPGTWRHLLCRKLWFHALATRFLKKGGGQVLILGAGLDPLGMRLVEQAGAAKVVEVDRPRVMAIKQEWFADVHPGGTGLRCVGLDLETLLDLDETLLVPHHKTLVLAEGLLMYLPEARVHELLATLVAWFTGPLEIGFSYVSAVELADPRSAVGRIAHAFSQKPGSEQFDWAICPGDLATWLRGTGLHLRETIGSTELAAQLSSRRPGEREYGEHLAMAGRPNTD